MWYYSLVLCYHWTYIGQGHAHYCPAVTIVDQDGEYTSNEACNEAAVDRTHRLAARPGWQDIVSGSFCSFGKPGSKLSLEEREHVINHFKEY